MSETIYVINPNFHCAFCGERFGCDPDRELIIVESGQMVPLRKDPSWLRFFPDHDNEREPELQDSAVVEYYHAECFIDRMRGCEWGLNAPVACDLCGKDFHRFRWAFRMMLGRQDYETSCFVPMSDTNNEAMLCPSCICEGFGEGDIEEGELLLGIAGR
jgi:hypothetical protein